MLAFSPPDITQEEIDEVVDTLKSGWITTGPKTKLFEKEIAKYCGTPKAVALNSATAAQEIALRLLGIGAGDEVITSAYTYTSTASAICHVGATPVLVDVAPGSFEMDYEALANAITPKTKAVVPVDIAGKIIDFEQLKQAVDSAQPLFEPTTKALESLGRVAIVVDGAHSFGALRHGRKAGQLGDFTTFSFHAVKNLTTAEGGALTWRDGWLDNEEIYKEAMLMALHGQTKDALAKTQAGAWEYDIAFPGWKCNMTDIQASLGLAQLRRYPELLQRRHDIIERYCDNLQGHPIEILKHSDGDALGEGYKSSAHLLLTNLVGKSRTYRDALIVKLANAGVPSNVHYKPLPLLSAYKNLGFREKDYPNALRQFETELSLPLHTLLQDEEVDFICEKLLESMTVLDSEGLS